MKISFFFIIICISTSFIYAQHPVITGKIKDSKGIPVPNANIIIKDSYDGATSDSSGKFHFTTTETGNKILMVTCIGYKKYEQPVFIQNGLTVEIVLKHEITELSAVTISAGTFEAGDRKRSAAVLDPIDVVTTASGNGDITGALKTLPGAQLIGESEGLFVRGGTAYETKIFIDGTLVNRFFYTSVPNIAQFSRFSPFLFKGTVFSTGGYSALYGQALSSALILESVDFPERSAANLGLSVLSADAGYQHLNKKKNMSFGINANFTHLGFAFSLIRQRQDYFQIPRFSNVEANFRIKTSSTGILKYYGFVSTNRLGFTVNSLDTLSFLDKFSLRNLNHYHNLSWRENLKNGWKLNLSFSFAENDDRIASGLQDDRKKDVLVSGLEFRNFQLRNKGRYINAKVVAEKKGKGMNVLRFGSELNYSDDETIFTAFTLQQFSSRVPDRIHSAFSETDLYLTRELALKAGMRFEYSSYLKKINYAPRLSLAVKLGSGAQASFAYGIFYQNPEKRYLPSPFDVNFMRADHYILQYQRVKNQQSLRIETFYKKYKNLIKTGEVNFVETVISHAGFGDAKGIEFFWRDKKTIKNFDYWISYSFLDTRRDFLNFPFAIRPNFAARHTASVVAKKFITAWKAGVNAAYNFSSGRPYYHIVPSGNGYSFTDRGTVPDYHNFSVSFNYLPFLGKRNPKSFPVLVFAVSNLLNIKQVFGYQYSYDGRRKQAIEPPSRMFVFAGLFFSFGIDRSEEIMNNTF
ncbi:MAG: TonB-dependent receptor [Chitinophagaceae bacterium]|nr:TonB-dependent receptor [Chitinophagaceae bacterium]